MSVPVHSLHFHYRKPVYSTDVQKTSLQYRWTQNHLHYTFQFLFYFVVLGNLFFAHLFKTNLQILHLSSFWELFEVLVISTCHRDNSLTHSWRNEDVEFVADWDGAVRVGLYLAVVLPAVLGLKVADHEVGPLQPQPPVPPDHHGAGREHSGTLRITKYSFISSSRDFFEFL